MNKEKNKINLNINTLEYLKNKKYSGLKSKYAPLILNVITANNNFPNKLKDCILDHNLIEAILLEPDFRFLINEFGKDISEFPFEFQDACNKLNIEFNFDYPEACKIDCSIKNKIYGKNFKSITQYYYYNTQFNEVRSEIRDLILDFTNKLGLVSNLQTYSVYASCPKIGENYKLKLQIYVREKNNFPNIFESKMFSTPIDKVSLKRIEHHYEWLSIAQKWGDQIDLEYIYTDGTEIKMIFPEIDISYPIFNKTS